MQTQIQTQSEPKTQDSQPGLTIDQISHQQQASGQVSQNENIILFRIEVNSGDHSYKVKFHYNVVEDSPQKIAQEMHRDLNLHVESIQVIESQIRNALEKYEAANSASRCTGQTLDSRSTLNYRQTVLLDKHVPVTDFQSNQKQELAQPYQRGPKVLDQQQINEQELQNQMRALKCQQENDYFSMAPEGSSLQNCSSISQIPFEINEQLSNSSGNRWDEAPLKDLVRKVSISQLSFEKQQCKMGNHLEGNDLKLQSPGHFAKDQEEEGGDDDPENEATVIGQEPQLAHNNTTGEMHEKMIQLQQQNGPIGDEKIVNNHLFRNSIMYKDPELNQFMNNSNENRERARRFEEEKEKKMKQEVSAKKNEDEDEMVFFILEEMFPGYARDYHEQHYLLQLHKQDSVENHASQCNSFAHQHTSHDCFQGHYMTASNQTFDNTVNLSFHSREENYFFPSGQTNSAVMTQSMNPQHPDVPFDTDLSLIEFPKHESMPHTDIYLKKPQAHSNNKQENHVPNTQLSRSQPGEISQQHPVSNNEGNESSHAAKNNAQNSTPHQQHHQDNFVEGLGVSILEQFHGLPIRPSSGLHAQLWATHQQDRQNNTCGHWNVIESSKEANGSEMLLPQTNSQLLGKPSNVSFFKYQNQLMKKQCSFNSKLGQMQHTQSQHPANYQQVNNISSKSSGDTANKTLQRRIVCQDMQQESHSGMSHSQHSIQQTSEGQKAAQHAFNYSRPPVHVTSDKNFISSSSIELSHSNHHRGSEQHIREQISSDDVGHTQGQLAMSTHAELKKGPAEEQTIKTAQPKHMMQDNSRSHEKRKSNKDQVTKDIKITIPQVSFTHKKKHPRQIQNSSNVVFTQITEDDREQEETQQPIQGLEEMSNQHFEFNSDCEQDLSPCSKERLSLKYDKIFTQKMKSELLKRACKRMYKDDIISLKEALIVIMPTLDSSSSSFCEDQVGTSQDATPSHDSHFCKITHKLVKRFKAQHGLEPVDGIVDCQVWDQIMKIAKQTFEQTMATGQCLLYLQSQAEAEFFPGTSSPDKLNYSQQVPFDQQSVSSVGSMQVLNNLCKYNQSKNQMLFKFLKKSCAQAMESDFQNMQSPTLNQHQLQGSPLSKKFQIHILMRERKIRSYSFD